MMELTSWMKIARFQTFWIQMRKNKPLGESRKSGQTSGTKYGILLFKLSTAITELRAINKQYN
ncbi:hypothetical protein Hanom_Chr10g00875151 [Helianthus anomalus]